jgi:hypothetical protein
MKKYELSANAVSIDSQCVQFAGSSFKEIIKYAIQKMNFGINDLVK